MRLVGVLNEPPFDPISWSGTAKYFFGALQRAGLLAGAIDATMPTGVDRLYRGLNIALPISRWKERYHLDVRRFRHFTRLAGRRLQSAGLQTEGVLQIGAWYCMPDQTRLPCYSYHDGNLALRIRSGLIGLDANHQRVRSALAWEQRTYSRLRGIFVMSQWLADSFVRDFDVPASKVHVVGAGINFDRLPEPSVRVPGVPKFLMVGKDFVRKGGPLLLEAFAKVRASVPSAELTLVGPTLADPPEGVRCLGFLSKRNPEDIHKLEQAYLDATIYVLPSLYEPFGISLLEAMAYSMPCIAADHCAMPEIVRHGVTGLVVKPGDSASLADAMLQLAQAPSLAQSMGTSGRQHLLDKYTWDAVAARIGQVTSVVSNS